MIPNSLPYIQINSPTPIKLLIDTGCHPSLFRPYFAEKYFPEKIIRHNTPIISCGGSREAQFKAKIPLLEEYNLLEALDFVLFDFHNYYDGIIGIRDLRKLKLNLNINNGILFNQTTKIKLEYRKNFNIQKFEIPPLSIIVKEISTTVNNGNMFLNEMENQDKTIIISSSLIHVNNGKTRIEFVNKSNYTELISINENFLNDHVENLEPNKYNYFSMEEIMNISTNINDFNDKQIYNNIDNKLSLENFRTEYLNKEISCLQLLIKEYRDIFYQPENKLTFTNEVKHKIKTTDEIPVYSKTYRYPFIHKEEIRKQINKMLEDGIIQPSQSPWSSCIWVVPKKLDASGKQKWRIVVDYRKLNEKTIDDRYPLPSIQDILDKLGRCQYFTTLVLASGFTQIEMDKDSIEKKNSF